MKLEGSIIALIVPSSLSQFKPLPKKNRPAFLLDNPIGKVYYKRRKAPAGAVEWEAAL